MLYLMKPVPQMDNHTFLPLEERAHVGLSFHPRLMDIGRTLQPQTEGHPATSFHLRLMDIICLLLPPQQDERSLASPSTPD